MVKRLAYWTIRIENIRENLEGFLSWLLRMHEVVFYAFDGKTLVIRIERKEDELERLKKDAELLGIKIEGV